MRSAQRNAVRRPGVARRNPGQSDSPVSHLRLARLWRVFLSAALAFGLMISAFPGSAVASESNTVLETITDFGYPIEAAVSPDGAVLYVTDVDAGKVKVIRTSDNVIVREITVGTDPDGVAVSPDGRYVYVALRGEGKLAIIDTEDSDSILKVTVDEGPGGVAVTPDGDRVYVSNSDADSVSVIDTSGPSVATTVSVQSGPGPIIASPDGAVVYVANRDSDSVSTIQVTDNAVANFDVGEGPRGLAISPDSTMLYVGNSGLDRVQAFLLSDTSTPAFQVDVGDGPFGLALTSDGSYLYVANETGRSVSVLNLDASPRAVVDTIPITFGKPTSLTISPDGSRVYVISADDESDPEEYGVVVISRQLSSESTSDSNPATVTEEKRAAAPGIHLDLQAQVGDVILGAPVVIGGEGLAGGSAYTLVVRSTPQVVDSGTASALGNFSKSVPMPALAPGSHILTLTATAPDGSTLTLAQPFTVDAIGAVTSLSATAGSTSAVLAATGVNTYFMLGGLSGLALLLLGVVMLTVARGRSSASSKLLRS